MEKIILNDHVRNEEMLRRDKEERNILHAINGSKAKLMGHILRRNCLLKHVTEGKIEGTGRRGRKRQHLLDCFKEAR